MNSWVTNITSLLKWSHKYATMNFMLKYFISSNIWISIVVGHIKQLKSITTEKFYDRIKVFFFFAPKRSIY